MIFLSICLLYKTLLLSSQQWSIPQTYLLEFKAKSQKKNSKKPNFQYTLPDIYLDQVIHRKKSNIQQCAGNFKVPSKDLFIELTILPSGQTKSRLINSKQKNPAVLHCIMNLLNRIKFKKFLGSPIVKNYHFQVQTPSEKPFIPIKI